MKELNFFVNERGFLTDEGKLLAARFKSEIGDILRIATNENELRLVGSILNSIVGDIVAGKVNDKR
jgi:hypothetical protein